VNVQYTPGSKVGIKRKVQKKIIKMQGIIGYSEYSAWTGKNQPKEGRLPK
jgi:hypothetical protein